MADRKMIYLDDAINALEREKIYSAVYKYGYTQTDYFKQYNMGLTDGIKALNKLPSAQPENTETHSCDCERTGTHDSRREWYMKGYRDAQNAATHDSCTDCPLYDHDRHNCPRFNRVIPATIEAAKPRWIAVEEALPEDDKRVLCQMKGGELVFGFHHGKYWAYGHKPIAWFPLPEPYKEGQE